MSLKARIISELTVLQKNEKDQKNPFKARAYGKVIDGLKVYNGALNSVNDLSAVPGIGKSIKEKITEIITTGQLAAAQVIRHDPKALALTALSNVYGIGPTKAKKLIAAGITTITELRQKADEELNDKQRIGLKYYEDLLERIPRAEMLQHKAVLDRVLSNPTFGIEEHSIVGSFRREAQNSGDIDLLVKFPTTMSAAEQGRKFKAVIAELQKEVYVIETLAAGPKKFMGICRVAADMKARRLDILVTPVSEYPFSLLYFTGSQEHNIMMRKRALDIKYSLNEHGFTPVPPNKVFKTEKDIFDFLSMEYKEPNDR